MNKIYYKEGENINNKNDYIINYLKLNTPTTYYKHNNFVQCRGGKARTFNDLLLLLRSKFKTATRGDLARILLHKNNMNIVGCVPCSYVKQMTFYSVDKKLFGRYAFNYEYSKHSTIEKGPQWKDLVRWATRKKDFELPEKYILKDPDEDIKALKELFINFLKEKNVYKEFVRNLRKQSKFKSIISLINSPYPPCEWVVGAFIWRKADTDISWAKIDTMWLTKLGSYEKK